MSSPHPGDALVARLDASVYETDEPVLYSVADGIATVTVHITVVYGSKVMPLCEKVQENVKQAIQNMTGITVARVDVLVVGLTDADKTEK